MTAPRPEDWKRVKEVFEAALSRPVERRLSFVDEACDRDLAIREQVVAMLAAHDHAAQFLETPAASLIGRDVRPDLTGRRIGPYELASRIGQGGMGEVYRARDTRLDRTVAIKVLAPHAPLGGHDRFEREARAVAALTHPHICTLYDVGSDAGIDFLVMEFLEGETLAERIDRGPLTSGHALQIAIQIASALHRAHASGIVHRDLKPRNIMLTKSGAKLLDFGLAKSTGAALVTAAPGREPSELTAPGLLLGTLHYMAPEQLEGLAADARTDLFAFGCVLYEMVTGRKAFEARSSASLLTAIMTDTPTPVRELQPGVPPGVEYVIGRCLEKDPGNRWQTARDLLAELERTTAQREATSAPASPNRSRLRVLAMVGAAVAIAATATVVYLSSRSAPAAVTSWLSILPPPGGFDPSPDPIISPDGRYVVFKAETPSHTAMLWLKDLQGPEVRPLPGTEGVAVTTAPFWSPDSRSIGFFAQGQLVRVEVDGSAPQALTRAAESHGATWTASGEIIFDSGNRLLHRIPATGGPPTLVPGTAPGQVRLFPHALPDGRHYLFTSRNVNDLGEGIYVASLDTPDVRRVSDAWSRAAYASGHLLFARQGTLFAQPFDLAQMSTTGEPRSLADGVGNGCCTPLSYAFSASRTTVAMWGGTFQARTQLRWLGRDGKHLATVGEPTWQAGIARSPDERRVAVERQNPTASNYDVWLLDLASGASASRFTLDGNATLPVWSPDGARVLVMYRTRGLVAIPLRGGDGTVVVGGAESKWPTDWSSDGDVAFYDAQDGWRLWTTPAQGQGKPVLYRQAPFTLSAMKFFPGGGWVAYISEESGQFEVYVDSFPTAGQKIRVSTNGGTAPVWRRDGKELYYLAPDRGFMAVPVSVESGTLRAAPPIRLFEAPAVGIDWSRTQFASDADGSRFLFNAVVEDRTPVGLTVIANWPALLARP